MPIKRVDDLLRRHFNETAEGLVDTAPSALRRGEGTEKSFFIMKIDLVKSTRLLLGRRAVTYLRLAHTFLSTVDRLTQDYGADGDQVEYGGDGLMVYFPAREGAEKVLSAACLSRAAVRRIRLLGGTLGELDLKCRVVLHYAPLTVAKIGPRANTVLTAIGMPLHRVSKIEKGIGDGQGWATEEFHGQLARENKKYLSAKFEEVVSAPPFWPLFGDSAQPASTILDGLFHVSPAPPPPRNRLLEALYTNSASTSSRPPPQATTSQRLVGYTINWMLLDRAMGVPIF